MTESDQWTRVNEYRGDERGVPTDDGDYRWAVLERDELQKTVPTGGS